MMKRFALTIAAAGFSLGAMLPVHAQEQAMAIDPETFTCAEFTALERDTQAEVLVALTAADDGIADVKGNADTGSNADITRVNTVCAGNDAMLVKDAMPAY